MFGPAHSAFQLGSHIRGYVQAVGVAAGKGQSKVPASLEVRLLKQQVDFLLQKAVGAAQGEGLLPAKEIVAGDIGQDTGCLLYTSRCV